MAPTAKDVHETKCSLNFGSRAMKVQVTAHVNYEVGGLFHVLDKSSFIGVVPPAFCIVVT